MLPCPFYFRDTVANPFINLKLKYFWGDSNCRAVVSQNIEKNCMGLSNIEEARKGLDYYNHEIFHRNIIILDFLRLLNNGGAKTLSYPFSCRHNGVK